MVAQAWTKEVQGYPMYRVWEKLKYVKTALKDLHQKHFAHSNQEVIKARDMLHDIQMQNNQDPNNEDLHAHEKTCNEELRHWLSVEESIYKQKSRMEWLKLGDANTHYFFSAMKEGYNRNKISSIYDEEGNFLLTQRKSVLKFTISMANS